MVSGVGGAGKGVAVSKRYRTLCLAGNPSGAGAPPTIHEAMTFYPIPDDPDFQPITGQRATIPDDYARCHGVQDPLGLVIIQCCNCLRRTTPRTIGCGSYMAPPEFTTDCPERIVP